MTSLKPNLHNDTKTETAPSHPFASLFHDEEVDLEVDLRDAKKCSASPKDWS